MYQNSSVNPDYIARDNAFELLMYLKFNPSILQEIDNDLLLDELFSLCACLSSKIRSKKI